MTTPKKALSLKQPWAWAVIHGKKNVENRKWNTQFRGPFWIHAAKGMSVAYYEEAKVFIEERGITIPPMQDLLLGGILGITNLVRVAHKTPTPSWTWHMPNQYGFLLEDTKEVPFVACPGALNFWTVPDTILDQLCYP